MTTYLKKGDKIKGEKIYCESRKLNILKPSPKTNRHKIQRVMLRNNAECIIEKETHHNTKNKKNDG